MYDTGLGVNNRNMDNGFMRSLANRIRRLFSKTSHLVFPRADRVLIKQQHDIQFQIVHPEVEKKEVEIHNLSKTGIGLKKNNEIVWQRLGLKVTGTLTVGPSTYRVIAEVRHITAGTVGAKFVSTDERVAEAIEKYLYLELASLGLKEVRADLLGKDGNSKRWFVDGKGNEYFQETQSGELQHFHMTYLNNYVEWRMGGKVRCGLVLPGDEADGPHMKRSNLIKFTEGDSREQIQMAQRFLLGISGLSGVEKDLVMVILQ